MIKSVLLMANDSPSFYSFRLELIKDLLKSNYKVYISLPYGKEVDLLEKMGCIFLNIPMNRKTKNPFKDFLLLLRYLKMLNKYNPSIVLTFTIKPNIYGGLACSILRIPYITNITGLGTAVENDGILNIITTTLYRMSLSKSSCVFFQNRSNLDFFQKKRINPKVSKLIPGSGVSLNRFYPLPYPCENSIEFLFIARIMKEKGINQYIDAAKYIRAKYPFTQFHVIGACEEDYYAILKELEKDGILIYHGTQFNVLPFIEKTHCTVLPSYYPEGMSNVLLESAACCRPLITTDRNGCKEIVDDSINGYIIKPKDSLSLIYAIENFLSLSYEQKKQMGIKSYEKVSVEFDRQIVVNAYLNEINCRL